MTDQGPEPDGLIPSELTRDDAAFADLVEEFLGGLPARLEQFDTALAQDDFGSLRRYAHQLKGSGGCYGYPALAELAARIEQEALNAQLEACTTGVHQMKDLVSRMVARTD